MSGCSMLRAPGYCSFANIATVSTWVKFGVQRGTWTVLKVGDKVSIYDALAMSILQHAGVTSGPGNLRFFLLKKDELILTSCVVAICVPMDTSPVAVYA